MHVAWADPGTALPALLIGYGSLREGTLARGIEALGAEISRERVVHA